MKKRKRDEENEEEAVGNAYLRLLGDLGKVSEEKSQSSEEESEEESDGENDTGSSSSSQESSGESAEGEEDSSSLSEEEEEASSSLSEEEEEESSSLSGEESEEDPQDSFFSHFSADLDYSALEASASLPLSYDRRVGNFRVRSTVDFESFAKGLCFVKERVKEKWVARHGPDSMTPFRSMFFRAMNSYCDVFYPDLPWSQRNNLRNLYVLHALNHVMKSRDRIMKGSKRVKKGATEVRDQGFSRPSVLILCPMRSDALDIIKIFMALCPSQITQIDHKGKLEKEFGVQEMGGFTDLSSKPPDFEKRFRANTDDLFRVGISFMKKSMRMYSDFYKADVIVASPLGLRTVIGTKEDKKRDFDFLSSIDLVVVDAAETLLMQNFEHLENVFAHLNLTPSRTRETDFSRLKTVHADGKAKYLRQTIILGEINSLELQKLFTGGSNRLKASFERISGDSAVTAVRAGTFKQIFYRIPWSGIETAVDSMFDHFVSAVLPDVVSSGKTGVLVYVASYFDFIRVRNYLKKQKISFGHICEYTPDPDITRDRSDFFHKKARILLYTERLDFYRRLHIRGVEHVVFYGLPSMPATYSETINAIQPKNRNKATCLALYNKLDWMKLKRIVGEKRCKKMLKSDKKMFMFY